MDILYVLKVLDILQLILWRKLTLMVDVDICVIIVDDHDSATQLRILRVLLRYILLLLLTHPIILLLLEALKFIMARWHGLSVVILGHLGLTNLKFLLLVVVHCDLSLGRSRRYLAWDINRTLPFVPCWCSHSTTHGLFLLIWLN